jgi:type II protein arginine methyltransferase
MNAAMCAIAQQCIEANGFADSITILPVHSSKLTPAMLRQHLRRRQGHDGKVDLIVTELMDSGLLGEHMIAALRHASRELLRPGGLVIPHSAVVVGQLIESQEIRRRRVFDPTRNFDDHRPLSEFYATGGQKFVVDEAYTCESLRSLPHTALCE